MNWNMDTILIFEKKNISYAGWLAGLRVISYAVRASKMSPHFLCKVGQPDPLFADQTQGESLRDGSIHIFTPKLIIIKSSIILFSLIYVIPLSLLQFLVFLLVMLPPIVVVLSSMSLRSPYLKKFWNICVLYLTLNLCFSFKIHY